MEVKYNEAIARYLVDICRRIESLPLSAIPSYKLNAMLIDYLVSFRCMAEKIQTVHDMNIVEYNILYNEMKRTASYLEVRAHAYGLIIHPTDLLKNINWN